MTRVSRLPAVLPFLVMMALLLAGIFVGGILGALLLALPIAFLSWLLYLTWPHLRTPERLLRAAVLLLLVGIAVTQIVPR